MIFLLPVVTFFRHTLCYYSPHWKKAFGLENIFPQNNILKMLGLQLQQYLQLAVSPLTLKDCKDLTFRLKNPGNLKCRPVASSFTHLTPVKQPGDNCAQVEGNGFQQGEARGTVKSGQRVISHRALVISRAESQTCVFASG